MADKDASLSIGVDTSAFEAGLKQTEAALKGSVDKMQGTLATLNGAFQKVQGAFMAFTAAVAGGVAFKAAINASNDWALDSLKLAKALGVSTEQASVLQVAMHKYGIESGTLITASQKISKQIFSNASAFETMGIKVGNAKDGYRPMMEVIGEATDKLRAIHDPIAQNIAGVQLFGRAWADVKPFLKVTSQAMEEAAATAKRLHLIVGPEGAAQAKQYKEQMNELGLVGKSLEIQFGNALMPVFTKIGAWMGEEAPAMGSVFATVLEGIGFAAQATWLALKDMGDGIGAMAAQAAALLSGDIAGFKAIGKMRDEESAKNQAKYEQMIANFGKPLPTRASTPEAQDGPHYDFEKGANAKDNKVGNWTAALEEKKLGLQESAQAEGRFYEMSKSDERAYWQTKLALTKDGEKERIAVRQKIAALGLGIMQDEFQAQLASYKTGEEAAGHALQAKMSFAQAETLMVSQKYGEQSKQAEEARAHEIKIAQEIATQKRAIADELANRERTGRQMAIDGAEQEARFMEQMGQITKAQLLEQEQKFAQARFEIEAQAVAEKLALLKADPTSDPVQAEKLESQLLEIRRKYALMGADLSRQLAIEQQAPMQAVANTMEQSFGRAVEGMLMKAQTLRQGLAGIFSSVLTTFTSEMITKPLALEAMKFIKQTAFYQSLSAFKLTSLLTEKTAETGADAASLASNTALAQSAAGLAATNAMASVAAIPITGWAMAPGVGAETFAVAGGFAAMASASGGYDIPAGVNPITQLHQSEMVLPSAQADVIRSLANGGGSGPVHIHARSDNDVIRAGDLKALLTKMNRNFVHVVLS